MSVIKKKEVGFKEFIRSGIGFWANGSTDQPTAGAEGPMERSYHLTYKIQPWGPTQEEQDLQGRYIARRS